MWQELLTFFISVLKLAPNVGPKNYDPVETETATVTKRRRKNENLTGSVNLPVPERKLLVLRRNPSKARGNPWKSREKVNQPDFTCLKKRKKEHLFPVKSFCNSVSYTSDSNPATVC
ncbi:hypothetical protein TNCV_2796581 [Trichonephila clavipes]|nr:hypothetical protein TNCV_2796581 [Trichonephila clavipes]